MDESGVEFLDHTADVGFALVATTRQGVFERSALALASLARADEDVGGAAPPAGGSALEVHACGDDDASLLAAWLRELVFLIATRHAVPCAVDVGSLSATEIVARVTFCADPPPVREIKGVTLHALRMERRYGFWEARVVFDV